MLPTNGKSAWIGFDHHVFICYCKTNQSLPHGMFLCQYFLRKADGQETSHLPIQTNIHYAGTWHEACQTPIGRYQNSSPSSSSFFFFSYKRDSLITNKDKQTAPTFNFHHMHPNARKGMLVCMIMHMN